MTTYDRMVFGMHHLCISQAGSKMTGAATYSHPAYELDLTGEDTGIDYWRNMMPNTYWYLAGKWGTSGTVFFWSVDANGNKKQVLCADGKLRYITMAMTHSYANYSIGKSIAYKDVMYQEGTNGFATGNHIHLEVCEGHVKTKVANGTVYNLPNMLDPRNVFFILDSYTTVKSTDGLTFKHTNEVSYTVAETAASSSSTTKTKKKLYFKPIKGSANIRRGVVDGKILGQIPVGKSATIIGFIREFSKDGYQWAQISYGGITGYVQLDTKYNILTSADGGSEYALFVPIKGNCGIRASYSTSAKLLGTIPVNGTAYIDGFYLGFSNDGYQWAKVIYNGIVGWVQLDTKYYQLRTE